MEPIKWPVFCLFTKRKLRFFVMEMYGGLLGNLRHNSCSLKIS